MKKDISIFLIAVAIGFSVIVGKFAHIQIIMAGDLQDDVIEQRVRVIEEKSPRGTIKDEQGNVMAISINVKDIAVYPNYLKSDSRMEVATESLVKGLKVTDVEAQEAIRGSLPKGVTEEVLRSELIKGLGTKEQEVERFLKRERSIESKRKEISKVLSERLDVKEEEVMKKLTETDEEGHLLKWARVAKKVDPEVANDLKNSDISSYLEITNSPRRLYLNGSLASNILGFVNEESEAGGGLEIGLDKYLSGTPGFRITEMDNMGSKIPIGLETISKPVPGSDVHLTINSYIQNILEEELSKAMDEMDADEMHAVIMRPDNGEIVAMASLPNFDPNNYQKYPKENYNRHPSSYVYEPGSTFKGVFMAAALETGAITPQSTFNDTGTITINGHTLKNWDRRALGQLSLEQIMVHSSNVGMVNISKTMTAKQIYDELSRVGYGKKTGIELPNDEAGIYPKYEWLKNDPLMQATQSYGHGIGVTPLQIAKSYAEIANGGYEVKPTLVKKVVDANGNEMLGQDQGKRKRVYKKETAENIKSYLEASWDNSLDTKPEGYSGGGKTGTSVKLENGVYSQKIVGSFVGYLPKENPEFVMIAVVDNPKEPGFIFGATTGGPIFKETMEEVMRYSNIPKDMLEEEGEIEEEMEFTFEDYSLELVEEAKVKIKEDQDQKVKVRVSGDGPIVSGSLFNYKKGAIEVTFETTEIKAGGKTNIPDLTNKYASEVYEMFKDTDIEVRFIGRGKVFEQSVEKGTYDKNVNEIIFWLE